MLVGQQQNHLQFRLASHQAHEHYDMKDVMMQGMLSEQNALMQQQQIIMLHERMDQIAAQHEQLLKVVAAGIHNVAYNTNQVLTALPQLVAQQASASSNAQHASQMLQSYMEAGFSNQQVGIQQLLSRPTFGAPPQSSAPITRLHSLPPSSHDRVPSVQQKRLAQRVEAVQGADLHLSADEIAATVTTVDDSNRPSSCSLVVATKSGRYKSGDVIIVMFPVEDCVLIPNIKSVQGGVSQWAEWRGRSLSDVSIADVVSSWDLGLYDVKSNSQIAPMRILESPFLKCATEYCFFLFLKTICYCLLQICFLVLIYF